MRRDATSRPTRPLLLLFLLLAGCWVTDKEIRGKLVVDKDKQVQETGEDTGQTRADE